MFCPKCGIQNPETGKFCRSCGTDLSPISEALAGKPRNRNFGMTIQPIQPMTVWDDRDDSKVSWHTMITTTFVGFAFLVISVVLGISGAANANRWWFWMLIPAFAMIGTGVAQYITLRKNEQQQRQLRSDPEPAPPKPLNETSNASLPPTRTEYVAPDSLYKTGDLVPPSVTDNTTRHLEINSEGETMTLPKK